MKNNNENANGAQGANVDKKTVSIAVMQSGVTIVSTELKGSQKDLEGEQAQKAIVRNIVAYLYRLLLIRKQTGQKIGLNLSKSFSFQFVFGRLKIDTLQAQTLLNISLKCGYKSEKRKRFENTLAVIVREVLAGNKLVTAKELAELNARIDDQLKMDELGKKAVKIAAKPRAKKEQIKPVAEIAAN